MYKLWVLFFGIIFGVCKQYPEPDFTTIPASSNVQTISLMGDSLRTPTFDEEAYRTLEQNRNKAEEVYHQDSSNIENLIWLGRRTAYLREYKKAVLIYSQGLEQNDESPWLYRHRGHRYITLRAFDHAVKDFEQAAKLINGKKDIVEPDGIPNAQNLPRSSLHTNIWYHLGLAYYLKGDFRSAQNAYQKCIMASTNDDMLVAAVYWYYMTLKRLGQDELAGKIIEPIHTEMDVIENDSYLKLLLVFKGEFEADLLLDTDSDALSNATLGYGIGNWHYINGRKERAVTIWQNVYDSDNWASFGFIASEAELARLN